MLSAPTPFEGPRAVSDADFPADAPVEDQLRFLLNYAVLAPSVLNTQPWRFAVEGPTVRLFADRTRQLTHLDPDGRELVVSCGAALFHFRVAARHHGYQAAVQPFPDAEGPDLLAAVTVTHRHPPDSANEALFRAIPHRKTHRAPFAAVPLPPDLVAAFQRAARDAGVGLVVIEDDARKTAVAELVEEGLRLQGADPAVNAELHAWLRPNRDPRRDGVRDRYQREGGLLSDARIPSPYLARQSRALVGEAPALLVFTTATDTPPDWLAAGQALAHVLLLAAGRDFAASYANQPIEVAALRPALARTVGGGVPHTVLRIGHPVPTEGTPRRAVQDVTDTP